MDIFNTSVENTDHFDVGKVIGKSEEGVLIYSYPAGDELPQMEYISADGIYRIAENTEYIDHIGNGNFKESDFSELADSSDLKKGLLCYCRSNSLAIEIELFNSDLVDAYGLVSEVNDESVVIDQLDDNDEPDGETEIMLESITRVAADITE